MLAFAAATATPTMRSAATAAAFRAAAPTAMWRTATAEMKGGAAAFRAAAADMCGRASRRREAGGGHARGMRRSYMRRSPGDPWTGNMGATVANRRLAKLRLALAGSPPGRAPRLRGSATMPVLIAVM